MVRGLFVGNNSKWIQIWINDKLVYYLIWIENLVKKVNLYSITLIIYVNSATDYVCWITIAEMEIMALSSSRKP